MVDKVKSFYKEVFTHKGRLDYKFFSFWMVVRGTQWKGVVPLGELEPEHFYHQSHLHRNAAAVKKMVGSNQLCKHHQKINKNGRCVQCHVTAAELLSVALASDMGAGLCPDYHIYDPVPASGLGMQGRMEQVSVTLDPHGRPWNTWFLALDLPSFGLRPSGEWTGGCKISLCLSLCLWWK